MNGVLAKMRRELHELREYIATLKLEVEIFGHPPAGPRSDFEAAILALRSRVGESANRRRLNYVTVVVSLYGVFEQYVRELLEAYLASLATWAPRYDALPETLQRAHLWESAGLLRRALERPDLSPASAEEIIKVLARCLENGSEFRFNAVAMTHHSSNLRGGTIVELLKRVGRDNGLQKCRDSSAMRSLLATRYPGQRSTVLDVKEVFADLDDLAERRNEAAHGIPLDLLSLELLSERVDYIEAVAEALYEVLEIESRRFEAMSGAALGTPIRVFSPRVCGIRLGSCDIAVGDRVLILTKSPSEPFKTASVESLQIDGVAYEHIVPEGPTEIGVRLSRPVRPSHLLFLLPQGRSWLRHA